MPWRLAVATRNTVGDALVDLLDIGGTATLQIRTGAQPSAADNAATGMLLAILTFHTPPSWSTFEAGQAVSELITSDTNIDNTGTAGHARLLNGNGSTHSDMDIGEGLLGTLSFDDISFIAGGTASITSMLISMPEE